MCHNINSLASVMCHNINSLASVMCRNINSLASVMCRSINSLASVMCWVGDNAILCTSCKKWIHKKCIRVVGRLKKGGDFKCSKCSEGGVKVVDEVRQFVLGAREELEVVDKFCYLGDVIGKGGGAEEASRARVRCAWGKFRDLRMLLTVRGASLRVKGKIYRTCVQRVLVYGSETWPMKKNDMQSL